VYNFDQLIAREGFDSIKWSYLDELALLLFKGKIQA